MYLNNIKIDIANAIPREGLSYTPDSDIWENGPDISNLIKSVNIDGHTISVVPLEEQLQTNFARGKENRIIEIIKIFKKEGFD